MSPVSSMRMHILPGRLGREVSPASSHFTPIARPEGFVTRRSSPVHFGRLGLALAFRPHERSPLLRAERFRDAKRFSFGLQEPPHGGRSEESASILTTIQEGLRRQSLRIPWINRRPRP